MDLTSPSVEPSFLWEQYSKSSGRSSNKLSLIYFISLEFPWNPWTKTIKWTPLEKKIRPDAKRLLVIRLLVKRGAQICVLVNIFIRRLHANLLGDVREVFYITEQVIVLAVKLGLKGLPVLGLRLRDFYLLAKILDVFLPLDNIFRPPLIYSQSKNLHSFPFVH
jgi:hypothetical protein